MTRFADTLLMLCVAKDSKCCKVTAKYSFLQLREKREDVGQILRKSKILRNFAGSEDE